MIIFLDRDPNLNQQIDCLVFNNDLLEDYNTSCYFFDFNLNICKNELDFYHDIDHFDILFSLREYCYHNLILDGMNYFLFIFIYDSVEVYLCDFVFVNFIPCDNCFFIVKKFSI